MRGVLGRVSAGAAGRILDFAKPGEIRTKQKACSVDERVHSERDEGEKFFDFFRWKLREPVCQRV